MLRASRRRGTRIAAMLGCVLAVPPAAAEPNGEWRARFEDRCVSMLGPQAAANRLQPDTTAVPADLWVTEAELRHTLQGRLAGQALSLGTNLLARAEREANGATADASRVNELHASADLGAWQASAGKKVVGWDVGYGFRPNDVVQQELRRTLFGATPEGRPLLQLERFGADSAATLVWVNPQRRADVTERGAGESALAWRGYRRFGAADGYAFARWGKHTRSSIGAAVSWVATDPLELHGSARWLRHYDGWRFDPASNETLLRANPWQQATLGHAAMALIGLNWTGASQQSVIAEVWFDGTALSGHQWTRWRSRNDALHRVGLPPAPAAGNLAWQATPFSAANLRRENVYLRLAWQPDKWTWAIDALIHPEDGGVLATASAQWQGDRWRFNAAWRQAAGARESILRQLPTRRTALLAATWAF
jgi:hypothetical protein